MIFFLCFSPVVSSSHLRAGASAIHKTSAGSVLERLLTCLARGAWSGVTHTTFASKALFYPLCLALEGEVDSCLIFLPLVSVLLFRFSVAREWPAHPVSFSSVGFLFHDTTVCGM